MKKRKDRSNTPEFREHYDNIIWRGRIPKSTRAGMTFKDKSKYNRKKKYKET